ncbi:MAG: acyl carrier protein [Rhodomicrobium sp.]
MSNVIRSAIRNFIEENFLFQIGDQNLADDQSLLEAGVVDSTGVLELVAFLEDTFHLQIADKDIIPQNLDTVDSITAFVGRTQLIAEAA